MGRMGYKNSAPDYNRESGLMVDMMDNQDDQDNPLRNLIAAQVRETGLAEKSVPFVVGKLTEHAEFLGAKPDPLASLFAYRSKLSEVAERFGHVGLTYEDYRDAAARKPTLFYMSPTRVIDNLTGVVTRLQHWGLTEAAYIPAVMKQQPQLAYLSPETTEHKAVETVAGLQPYGMRGPLFVKAALKRMQLLYQASATITGHGHAIFRMQEREIITPHCDLLNFLVNSPDKLTLGQSNLQLRVVYALAKRITQATLRAFWRCSAALWKSLWSRIMGWIPTRNRFRRLMRWLMTARRSGGDIGRF